MAQEEAKTSVSIVIPTYRGLPFLRDCLPSVQAAIARAGMEDGTEIIVVDDGGGDGTLEWLAREYPSVRGLQTAANGGFAVAANTGLRAAKGQWVALLNNDVIVDADWLASVREHLGDPRLGHIATRIVDHDRPDAIESAGDEYTVVGVPLQFRRLRPVPEALMPRIAFSGCGASVFYRRAALDEVRLFYEPLGAYYEDVELGFRLNLRGWDCLYEPRSLCRHRGSSTYGRGSFRQKFNTARNAEIVFYTCMPAALLGRYWGSHLLAQGMHLIRHAALGTAWPFLLGKLAFLGCLPAVWRRRRDVQRLRSVSSRRLRDRMTRHWFRALVLRRYSPSDRAGPAAAPGRSE